MIGTTKKYFMENNKPCNPCQLEFFDPTEFTSYSRSSETLSSRQLLKKSCSQIKMTTRTRGVIKNYFIDDCQLRGLTESEVMRRIMKFYYEQIDSNPELKGKEFEEITKFVGEWLAFRSEIINSFPQLKGKEFEEIKKFMICK